MWVECDSCGCLIDAAEDPEAYRQRIDKWLCPECRGEWAPEIHEEDARYE